ncbi:deoxyribonuclease-4 [Desulfitispora alkaliphila]|uniref:deoxyribonuclease IV n=1 Tax=Desulfitispora alkaliphila TaxID=622674 RepID=UPI003D246BBF
MKIGCHVSIARGLYKAVEEAVAIDANVIQIFSRNPRGGKAKQLDQAEINRALELAESHGVMIISHAPYTINLCSNKDDVRKFAVDVLTEDLQRMETCGANYLIVHPGSHVNQGREQGIEYIIQGINSVMDNYHGKTTLLLETMSGQGTEVGSDFAEMEAILGQVNQPERVGICIDTCHLFAGGYAVKEPDLLIEQISARVPIEKIKVAHLNDSIKPFGSNRDRHAPLGDGELGWEAVMGFVTHTQLKHLPYILETPGGLDNYRKEIAEIKGRIKEIQEKR